jgi:pimeloyl-ACP methyl ester carboxylesterase
MAQWVFVHGAGASHEFWLGQEEAFPVARRLDLPGHGPFPRTHGPPPADSNPPLPAISIDGYADWIAGQAEVEGWHDVLLVGHSMGGAIVLALALRRPAWLRGLVLASTGARLRVAPELLRLLTEDYPAAVEWIVANTFGPQAHPYRREGARRQLLRMPPAVTLGDYQACDAFDVRAALEAEALTVPTLVNCRTDDVTTPPKYSEYLAAHLPHASSAWVGNAGHRAPLEQPQSWNAAVLAWAEHLA